MRKLARAAAVTGGLLLAVWPLVAGAQMAPKVSFVSPTDGSTVTGPGVDVKLKIEDFTTVDAGSPVKAGEGHAHILIDRDPVPAGQTIPTDQPNIVHLGKAPYDSRTIQLAAGKHTLTAELADSSHKALAPIVTAKVTVDVTAAGASPPAHPSNTGDGSLAGPRIGVGALLALGLAALALASRSAARRS